MKMRPALLLPLVLALSAAAPAWAGHGKTHIDHDGLQLDFDGDTLIVESGENDRDTVEISADFDLTVNGHRIETDRKDRKLLQAYYEKAGEIDEAARQIGLEGARIGVKGAALGVSALGKVIHLLSSDYDSDDLEEEIEAEAEKIESQAEGLEEAAELLEEQVEELEEIADDLQDRIPALDDLDWF